MDIAFLVFVIGAGIGILSELAFIGYGDFSVERLISVALGAAVIGIAVAMRGGANWARITLTVLAGITLVLGLIAVAGASIVMALLGMLGTVLMLVLVVQLVAMAAGIFFMYRPDSNNYFASPERRV